MGLTLNFCCCAPFCHVPQSTLQRRGPVGRGVVRPGEVASEGGGSRAPRAAGDDSQSMAAEFYLDVEVSNQKGLQNATADSRFNVKMTHPRSAASGLPLARARGDGRPGRPRLPRPPTGREARKPSCPAPLAPPARSVRELKLLLEPAAAPREAHPPEDGWLRLTEEDGYLMAAYGGEPLIREARGNPKT